MATSSYPTDLTDVQWQRVEALLKAAEAHRPGPSPGDGRAAFDALLYQAHTGCQWRFLPTEFGPWTKVWGRFRRWSETGALGPVLLGLHGKARLEHHRADVLPSLIVIDTHLARGATNGGGTFHTRGGPHGATKGAKRVIAVDVTGLPLVALAVPASTSELRAVGLLLAKLTRLGGTSRLEKVLVDKGVFPKSAAELGKEFTVEVERYGWKDHPQPFQPIARAWRVETAHQALGRSRRLSKSFEQTEASATTWLELAAISIVLDTWLVRDSRTRTDAEQAAMDARRAAPLIKPRPGDVGLIPVP